MPVDLPPQETESEQAAAVRGWCDEVIRLGRFDLQIRTSETDERINVRFYGGDSELLIDRHGELLDALQVLANKALTGRRVEKDIEMDCEEFKAQRVEELEQRARETADRVRRDRREQLLPAMSPIERRIVHLALQDDRDVTTESRGEGFFKRVAVILRPPAAEGEQQPSQEP
jgi:spoIIIJ-associated protein